MIFVLCYGTTIIVHRAEGSTMEDVRISRQITTAPDLLRDERLTAGLIAQYIHELSGRHAAARHDRTEITEPAGA
jgi:hypothetical protein